MGTTYVNKSVEVVFDLVQLDDLVRIIVPALASRPVIGLSGGLGAGKTTFVRAFCKEFGIYDEVSSPSYLLENRYAGNNNDVLIRHWDLYRVEESEELLEAILDFSVSEGITQEILLIEWPEKFPLLSEYLQCHLEFSMVSDAEIDQTKRRVWYRDKGLTEALEKALKSISIQ
jgi:tRNA threonylcarbamoyladenosine biosynthesis protein TsaE